ncbi:MULTISPECIES: hypothetical protein [unclassified Mesorhizobium]|uniref:hypothetical protein n=1 Tax=unclassified Mesorhizobium TaxID=325217 RepID=UPI003334F99D
MAKEVRERRASFGICLVSQRVTALAHAIVHREFFGFVCGPQRRPLRKAGLTPADLRGEPSVSFKLTIFRTRCGPSRLLRSEGRLNAESLAWLKFGRVRRKIVAGLGISPLPLHVAM